MYAFVADHVFGLNGLVNFSNIVFRDLQQLREFMASRPELRANFLRIVSADLATKLRDAAMVVSGFRGEEIASEAPLRGA